MELFQNKNIPLSRRMMPKNLEGFIGQAHLVSEGKPIYTMLKNKIIHSMIFYGPPATGKTSLAEIIANTLEYSFIGSNAVTLDSEEIRKIIERASNNAKSGLGTILFVDEIHRLIKPKQDAMLSAMENGELILIGATTENPYFSFQPALRSRLFIYEFKPHTKEELEIILNNALKRDTILSNLAIDIEKEAKEYLLDISADSRILLNILEMCVLSFGTKEKINITKEFIKSIIQSADTKYSDKEGHYDVISAFIKSVRGSDIDAALYYLALMIESGEDPLFIARRLIILSAEDVGLAYPEALGVAVSCYEAIERIGMPEGKIVLAEVTAFLALLPKSNSAYAALERAIDDIKKGNLMQVPLHLRSSSFSGAEKLGKGKDYLYPHDYPFHYVKQKYTEKMVSYFKWGNLGFEKKLKEWIEKVKSEKKDGK